MWSYDRSAVYPITTGFATYGHRSCLLYGEILHDIWQSNKQTLTMTYYLICVYSLCLVYICHVRRVITSPTVFHTSNYTKYRAIFVRTFEELIGKDLYGGWVKFARTSYGARVSSMRFCGGCTGMVPYILATISPKIVRLLHGYHAASELRKMPVRLSCNDRTVCLLDTG